MNLCLLRLDKPTPLFAGVLTRNRFPGHPVLLARELLDRETSRGVIINNRIANVGASGGLEAAREITRNLEALDAPDRGSYFAASTGVVGWELPQKAMQEALPALTASLRGDSLLPLARGIMTTDAFPKLRSLPVGEGRITATVKGAGMIEPHMATLLGFILTDLAVDRGELRSALGEAVEQTFNRITVDGDQSTSDMVLAFSSGLKPAVSPEKFRAALTQVCGDLAQDLVRNGEGVGHVIRVTVKGAAGSAEALKLAKAVGNSPLVKTAMAGNDPNVGRILSALGDAAGEGNLGFKPERTVLSLGGEVVYQKGRFELDPEKEDRLSAALRLAALGAGKKPFPEHERTVDITAVLGLGAGEAVILAADLTHGYVSENADYRS
jgi:glutamate N-acetyltransferase/amino-acid N-acetyltransferase